jgi:hypothetical protein
MTHLELVSSHFFNYFASLRLLLALFLFLLPERASFMQRLLHPSSE